MLDYFLLRSISCRKLRDVLTARVLKFLNERSQKQAEDYEKFYKDYSIFLKEGIVTTDDQKQKVLMLFIFIEKNIVLCLQ